MNLGFTFTLCRLSEIETASFPQNGIERLYIYVYMYGENMTKRERRKNNDEEQKGPVRALQYSIIASFYIYRIEAIFEQICFLPIVVHGCVIFT